MNFHKIVDVIFILISFGIYIIILNTDKNIGNANFLSRHIWIPLVLSYFLGRFVSLYKQKNKTTH